MNLNVLGAVFRRNFVSYFANPTGYLFICVFVLLNALAAFWPHDFFNSNLADLGQLNRSFLWIMLIFIPAITMSIWADERRQGTDELLLTIPGSDFDIVLGKYLAAVAIFSVSLAFSLICNFVVLSFLGSPDPGLYFGTAVGYWFVGMAMLGIGMMASFLTGNLTVSYILGVIFNAPLVALAYADTALSGDVASVVKQWSLAERFADFGRGVVSLSGVAYFLGVIAVAVYVAMVLIGRRHWQSGVAGMPAWLFNLLLHGLWLTSFAALGVALLRHLGSAYANVHIVAGLVLGYLLLHVIFLVVWGGRPVAQQASALHVIVPVLHLTSIVLFAGFLTLLESQVLDGMWKIWVVYSLFGVTMLILAVLWLATPPASSLVPSHYTLRTLMLVALVMAANVFFKSHDGRLDVTAERLSSLSPDTRALLDNLKIERPIQIEAFVSPRVPEGFVAQRLNLLAMLRELDASGKGKIRLQVNNTERYSEEASRAEKTYGIMPRPVMTLNRGVQTEEFLFMGVAFRSGLQRVILPFIDRGIPVEYELVRSICTVAQQKRKKIGVLQTDAQLYGSFNMQTMSSGGNWPIIDELEKQYELTQVDATNPITEKFDVLLAVQPSSLGPQQFDNFLAAIQNGQAAAIFEDPFPAMAGNVPATSAPKQAPNQGMPFMMQQQQPQPKGDIAKLWQLLGVDFAADKIVWQDYNPYRKAASFPKEFVFVDDAIAKDPFNEASPISSKLQHMLFPFPGAVGKLRASNLQFTPLVYTGEQTGVVNYNDLFEGLPFMPRREINPNPLRSTTREKYVLAAEIRGKIKPPQEMADDKPADEKKADAKPVEAKPADAKKADAKPAEAKAGDAKPADAKPADAKPAEPPKPKEVDLHVVVVADIDMLSRPFFRLREMGNVPELDIHFDFDNVTFVLNMLDDLAGDQRFLDIRKRRPEHRSLAKIDMLTESSRKDAAEAREKAIKRAEEEKNKAQKDFDESIKTIEKDLQTKNLPVRDVAIRIEMARRNGQNRLTAKSEQLEADKNREVNRVETALALKIRQVQNWFKLWAVIVPPLPPLFLALIVFMIRRSQERLGVSRRRLR